MFISLKTKIWLTVLPIVLMFTFFTLFYFPAQQGRFFFKNYHNEIQNLGNSVALGVSIALNEQNYEGVKTAMEFVKGNAALRFVSLLQADTVWNNENTRYSIKKSVFKTFPENVHPDPGMISNDELIIKRAPFHSSMMDGDILLGFTTQEIKESQKKIRLISLIVSGGIFLVGMLIGWWLSKSISVPILALRNAAKRVSKGDLTPVVKSYSNDEIGELAKDFNNMVLDLSKAEHLNYLNRTLSDTNTTLNATLQDLKATQAKLIQSEKMASLGELTAGIAHEIQNPLNFVNNFSEVNMELIDEMEKELNAGNEVEVIAIANNIKQNLEKTNYHGHRADAIVKGMLQHSRISTGKKEPTDINALIDECLRLSYHGFRAKDKSFNATMQTNFDPTIGTIAIVRQDIGRVLLNIMNNAFYSVTEKKKQYSKALITESDGPDEKEYSPTVTFSTMKLNTPSGSIEIKIKDNGMGISQKVLDKIYQPFFTTKPAGQGTGLGLSLSYDIITKEHGGELKVETKEGEFAEFIITLPG